MSERRIQKRKNPEWIKRQCGVCLCGVCVRACLFVFGGRLSVVAVVGRQWNSIYIFAFVASTHSAEYEEMDGRQEALGQMKERIRSFQFI